MAGEVIRNNLSTNINSRHKKKKAFSAECTRSASLMIQTKQPCGTLNFTAFNFFSCHFYFEFEDP